MRPSSRSVWLVVVPVTILLVALLTVAVPIPVGAQATQFIDASLRNGDYGGGSTSAPGPTDGRVDGPDGITFVSVNSGNRSNAIITWNLSSLGVDKADFRRSGTLSFMVRASSADLVAGEIVAENYGFNRFRNGQGTFALRLLSTTNSYAQFRADVWLSGFWHRVRTDDAFPLDSWHHVGYTWGDSDADFKVCVDGQVIDSYDTPSFRSLPWGSSGLGSAEQFGLGSHHERGFNVPGTAAGVTLADFRVWTDPVPACGTVGGPLEIDIVLSGKVNVRSRGVIPMVIPTTAVGDGEEIDFDATAVDGSTLAFGPAGAGIAHPPLGHFEDVDDDGDTDLVVHFRTQETGIVCGTEEAVLTGETLGGEAFVGVAGIDTKGCN